MGTSRLELRMAHARKTFCWSAYSRSVALRSGKRKAARTWSTPARCRSSALCYVARAAAPCLSLTLAPAGLVAVQ